MLIFYFMLLSVCAWSHADVSHLSRQYLPPARHVPVWEDNGEPMLKVVVNPPVKTTLENARIVDVAADGPSNDLTAQDPTPFPLIPGQPQFPGSNFLPGAALPGFQQGGFPQGGFPQGGFPQGGFPQGGFPQSGFPQSFNPASQQQIPQGFPQGLPQGFPQGFASGNLQQGGDFFNQAQQQFGSQIPQGFPNLPQFSALNPGFPSSAGFQQPTPFDGPIPSLGPGSQGGFGFPTNFLDEGSSDTVYGANGGYLYEKPQRKF